MLKENKGITLVALVITIIVMLILAGVSISLVVGDNGVLTNATNAVDSSAVAEVQQNVETAVASLQTSCLADYATNRTVKFYNYISAENLAANSTYSASDFEVSSLSTDSDNHYYYTISVTSSNGETVTGTLTFTSDLYGSMSWN